MSKKVVHILLVLCFSPVINAAGHSLWTMSNETNMKLSVICRGIDLYGLPGIDVSTDEIKIEPMSQANHDFSYMHNDGMGLNPATFTCEVKAKNNDATTTFRTTWGENVLLKITLDDDGSLRIVKLSR